MENNNNKAEVKPVNSLNINNKPTEVNINGIKVDMNQNVGFNLKAPLPQLNISETLPSNTINNLDGTLKITTTNPFKPVVGPLFKVDFKPFNKTSDIVSSPNQEIPIKDHLEEFRLIKTIEKTDDALLNAVLSYSVYEEKEWILNYIGKSWSSEIKDKLTECIINSNGSEATTEKNIETLFDLKLLTFCQDFFTPLSTDKLKEYSANELIFVSENTNEPIKINSMQKELWLKHNESQEQLKETPKEAGVYIDGFFSNSDDFAHAHVLLSKHPKGGNVLHLSFRGTEFSRGLLYLVGKYIPQAYLDMSAYYDKNFKSLEKAIMAYARDPQNEIKEIQVTGHSLGGSMVQEFLKNNPVKPKNSNTTLSINEEFEPAILGYTFGSPGSQKTKVMSFLTLLGHTALAVIDATKTVVSLGKINKIDKFLRHINQIRNNTLLTNPYKKDNRLVEYYHTTDPIPALGALGYKHNGEQIKLYDRMNADDLALKLTKKAKTSKVGKFLNLVVNHIPVVNSVKNFAITFHGIRRYVINLKDIIDDNYTKHPDLASKFNNVTQYTDEFKKADKKFIETIEKNKDEVAYAIKSSFYSKEQLCNQYNEAKNKNDKQKVIEEIKKQGFDLQEVLSEVKHPDYTNKFTAEVAINKITDMCRFDTFASFVLEQQKASKTKNRKVPTESFLQGVVGKAISISNPAGYGTILNSQINFKSGKVYNPFISNLSHQEKVNSLSSYMQYSQDECSTVFEKSNPPNVKNLLGGNFIINENSTSTSYAPHKIEEMIFQAKPVNVQPIEIKEGIDLSIGINGIDKSNSTQKTLTIKDVLNKDSEVVNLNSINNQTPNHTKPIELSNTTSSEIGEKKYSTPSIAEKRKKLGIIEKIEEVKHRFNI